MGNTEGIASVDDSEEGGLDYPFSGTAHELAHQWWAHQVTGAEMQGATLLSESLAEYSSLKLLEKEYGIDMAAKFLKQSNNGYIFSRANETRKESALFQVDNQGYIHYRKGSVVIYAIQQLIGEDKMNIALSNLVQKYGYKEPPYPNSYALLDELYPLVPDSFKHMVRNGLEEIIIFNTDIEEAFNACERCRKALAAHIIPIDYQGEKSNLSLSVSIGVTSAQGLLVDLNELLRIADHGLYKAKENGRNQTVIEGEFSMNEADTQLKEQEKYPGINHQVGLNNVLGDEDLFADILVMFHQDHGQDHNNIQQAIDENDQQKVKHLVHTIKGVSCSIGAMDLFDLCKELDIAVSENNSEQYQGLFAPLKTELVKVTAGIELHLRDKL